MLQSLIRRVKAFRKHQYFKDDLFRTQKKYACIGVGMHSLTNLYPILRHYGVSLKYICTKNSRVPDEMQRLFPGAQCIHDISTITNDAEVAGVFISAAPQEHFELVHQLLNAGKKVFVEKPPCSSLAELEQLLAIPGDITCKVGLQRRHWPATAILRQKIKHARSYTYRFHTGRYAEGDLLTELFIHPLDFAIHLFGAAELRSCFFQKDQGGHTLQLHLMHKGVSGLIECSTQHSWNSAIDQLTINTRNEELFAAYPALLEGRQRPPRFLNIPAERLLKQPETAVRYFSTQNYLLPVGDLQSLVAQGFYGELKSFIGIVEAFSLPKEKNDLVALRNLYEIFEGIRKAG